MNNNYRSYEIQIKTPQNELTIKPPLSMNFQITKNTLASANKCNLTIYNLGSSTRSKLYKDRFNTTGYFQIIIKAGYTGEYPHFNFNASRKFELPIVFKGNIYECSSYKQLNNWITTFDCFDGGYAIQNGFTSTTIAADTSLENMTKKLLTDMPNMVMGFFGNLQNTNNKRGKVLHGNTYNIIQDETNNKAFIDDETLNVLEYNEVIGSEVILLDSSFLRTTPKRRDVYLDCECSFFPEAKIKKICQIYSDDISNVDPYKKLYFGQYAIHGYNHNVNIMSNSCGDATTTLNLYYGAGALIQV